jgi:transcriptional regulator with XRE-family HTH domain
VPKRLRRALLTEEHYQLAELLRALRDEAGLTQVQVAKRLGRDQGYVSKYESAERRVDLIQWRDICGALGLDLITVVKRFEREASDGSTPPAEWPMETRAICNGRARKPPRRLWSAL